MYGDKKAICICNGITKKRYLVQFISVVNLDFFLWFMKAKVYKVESCKSILLLISCHCLISSRGGQGTSLQIIGLAAIDSHSQKVHTKRYKIPSFGVNWDPILSEIQIFKSVKIYKQRYGHVDAVSGWTNISLKNLPYLNGCISVKISPINTKLGDF